jgi:hypothetical protein
MRTILHTARATLVAVVVLGVALTSWAQTKPATGFASLSPGEQKIARALFEAQAKGGTATPLTLDQIAAGKTPGKDGWGRVFKSMKEQGLLGNAKNLGEVVSSYEKRHPEAASTTAKADKVKPEKVEKVAKPDKPEKPEKAEKPGR